MQVAYLARYVRVVTYDPPGNGRSGRPGTGDDFDRAAADARAVLDVTETARAVQTNLVLREFLAPAAPSRRTWHFEQTVHVPHRLGRYGAGTRMDYHETMPEALAQAIADGLKQPVFYRDVETDGARRAAALIAPLLEGGARQP